jgi:hypothetical protein
MIVAPGALKFFKVVRLASSFIAREGLLRNEFGRNGMNVDYTTRRRRGDLLGSNGTLRNEFDHNGINVDCITRRRRGDLLGSNGTLRNEFDRNGMNVDYTTRRRRGENLDGVLRLALVDFGVCAPDRFTALHSVLVVTICGVTAGTLLSVRFRQRGREGFHGFAA